MTQLKLILERLKKPSVILSITAQVITVLTLLNVNVDKTVVIGLVTAVCSILTLLGILSNPSNKNQWYADDIYTCPNCGKKTVHVMVNGKMVCSECGSEYTEQK